MLVKNEADLEGCSPPRPTYRLICIIVHIIQKPNWIVPKIVVCHHWQIQGEGLGSRNPPSKWNHYTRGLRCLSNKLLRATRGAHNPNLQVVITHASHVCSQHSFGLPLRMNGMHKTQFDHARFDLYPSKTWPSVTWNLRKARRWSKSVWTSDRCRRHFLTFGYY